MAQPQASAGKVSNLFDLGNQLRQAPEAAPATPSRLRQAVGATTGYDAQAALLKPKPSAPDFAAQKQQALTLGQAHLANVDGVLNAHSRNGTPGSAAKQTSEEMLALVRQIHGAGTAEEVEAIKQKLALLSRASLPGLHDGQTQARDVKSKQSSEAITAAKNVQKVATTGLKVVGGMAGINPYAMSALVDSAESVGNQTAGNNGRLSLGRLATDVAVGQAQTLTGKLIGQGTGLGELGGAGKAAEKVFAKGGELASKPVFQHFFGH